MKSFKKSIHPIAINLAIVLTAIVAVLIFVTTFFTLYKLDELFYGYLAVQHLIQRLISVLLIVCVWNLYMRKQTAWLITVILLFINLFSYLVMHHHWVHFTVIIAEIFILTVLLIYRKDFHRRSSRLSILKAAWIGVIGASVAFLNVVFVYFNLKQRFDGKITFGDAVEETVDVLFTGDTSVVLAQHPTLEKIVFWIFWSCIIAAFIFILNTAVHNRQTSSREREKARELVKTYGMTTLSYLNLENDKILYFGKEVEGVIGYGIVGNVIVVNSDPVCAPENLMQFLGEFKAFCKEGSYQCIFLSTGETFLDAYKSLGYSCVKCGEEARFDLQIYNLAGGKMAKMRAHVNHANKAGLITEEYRPLEKKNPAIEAEIEKVSEAWLEGKKSGQLGFSVGGVGLSNPMDRRYFYAKDSKGNIVAFNVFLPFDSMNGYVADVTRRKPDAPSGVTEKIMFDAFSTFKEEGIRWGSMGLCSLANVLEKDKPDSNTAKLMHFIYEKGNNFYGFKDLHMAKEKYRPTSWEPGYFVYSTYAITPQMVYAVVRIQNPQGTLDYIKGFVGQKKKEQIKNHEKE